MGPVGAARTQDAIAKAMWTALAGAGRLDRRRPAGPRSRRPLARAAPDAAAARGWRSRRPTTRTGSRRTCRCAPTWDGYLEGLCVQAASRDQAEGAQARRAKPAPTGSDRDEGVAQPAAGPVRGAASHDRGTQGSVHGAGDGDLLPTSGRGVLRRRRLPVSTFIEVGEQLAAGTIGFEFGGDRLLYNSAFDRAWGNLAPGMVLVGEDIRLAIESGCSAFDMLKGDYQYKYRFGAHPRAVKRLIVSRP